MFLVGWLVAGWLVHRGKCGYWYKSSSYKLSTDHPTFPPSLLSLIHDSQTQIHPPPTHTEMPYTGPRNPNPAPGDAFIIIYGYIPSLILGIIAMISFVVVLICQLVWLVKGKIGGARWFHGLMVLGCVSCEFSDRVLERWIFNFFHTHSFSLPLLSLSLPLSLSPRCLFLSVFSFVPRRAGRLSQWKA